MDRLKERQLTQRATRRPCEYNYTNADIHNPNVQPSDGYQFEYPVNWAGDPSTHKVIGLRRINYRATSVNIAFNFVVVYLPTDDTAETTTETIPIIACYTSENTFEECWTDIMRQIDKKITEDNLQDTIKVIQAYNKDTGECKIRFENTENAYAFKLDFVYGSDVSYDHTVADHYKNASKIFFKCEFLKLFNQQINKENVDKLVLHNVNPEDYTDITGSATLTFTNVWNRDSFYCHASFSDSPRKIIGINKDFWMTPSVFYEYSDNSNDFNVYFTTDTVHRILPRNGVLLIQISYIFNYQTSYLTY
jgi:hypothetical protein